MSKVYKPSSECIEQIKADTFNQDCGSASQVLKHYVETSHLTSRSLNSIEILVHNSNNTKQSNTKSHTKHLSKRATFNYCNRIALSSRTLKYSVLLLVSLTSVLYLVFLFVVGVIYLRDCPLENNIPIYLLVSGLTGLFRFFLLYACPFKYSDSLGAKLYETLVKLLLVKRFKYSIQTSRELNLNWCFVIYSYFCSCCFSLPSCCLSNATSSTNHLSDSTDYMDSYSTSRSTATDTSAISVLLNDACCCFSCVDTCARSSSLDNELGSRSNKLKRSQSYTTNSTSQYHHRHDSFYPNYVHYNKRIRRKHNKTQQNYKIIDFRSIRYGTAHLAQRTLDVFMLVWFLFGNYWVFNADMSVSMQSLKLNSTLSGVQRFKREENRLFSVNGTITSCSPVCYKTAFSQILITYSVFALSFVILITFRIYSLRSANNKNSDDDNNNKNSKNLNKKNKKQKFRRRANSLP